MQIFVRTIRHSTHRYPTCGDWWWLPDKDELHIDVSQTGSDLYNMLIIIHELVEAFWCIRNGITTAQVDDWDIYWERERDAHPNKPRMHDEPGNDPLAPYHPGHRLADVIERMAAFVLHADWDHYEYTLGHMDTVYGRPRYRIEPTGTFLRLSTRVGAVEPERASAPGPHSSDTPKTAPQNQKEARGCEETQNRGQASDYGRRSTQVPQEAQEDTQDRRTTQKEISVSYNQEGQDQVDTDEEIEFAQSQSQRPGEGVDKARDPSPSPVRKGAQSGEDGW